MLAPRVNQIMMNLRSFFAEIACRKLQIALQNETHSLREIRKENWKMKAFRGFPNCTVVKANGIIRPLTSLGF